LGTRFTARQLLLRRLVVDALAPPLLVVTSDPPSEMSALMIPAHTTPAILTVVVVGMTGTVIDMAAIDMVVIAMGDHPAEEGDTTMTDPAGVAAGTRTVVVGTN